MRKSLVIKDAEFNGRRDVDVRIEDGVIIEVGRGLARGEREIDAKGGAVIRGLVDHHIHLLAAAAQSSSIALDRVKTRSELMDVLGKAIASKPPGTWVRATGYNEAVAGLDIQPLLNRVGPEHPIRIKDRTGALWIFNSMALSRMSWDDAPPGVERGEDGSPTGRIWREDDWIGSQVGEELPDVAALGRKLASYGVTAVTDPTPNTNEARANLLADCYRGGALAQRLRLMSAGALYEPSDQAFAVGPVKVILDERSLPSLQEFGDRIVAAREMGRNVAVHCVTAAETALALAGFAHCGTRSGDRLEHGSIIDVYAIDQIRSLGLSVVTNPGFIHRHGDRYLQNVAPEERLDLYRCGSLVKANVRMAAGSDAPYGPLDPWMAIRTAMSRSTSAGAVVVEEEAIPGRTALALYNAVDPSSMLTLSEFGPGDPADICILREPLEAALQRPNKDMVKATLVAGDIVYDSD